jgi:hypothetical protein
MTAMPTLHSWRSEGKVLQVVMECGFGCLKDWKTWNYGALVVTVAREKEATWVMSSVIWGQGGILMEILKVSAESISPQMSYQHGGRALEMVM